MGQGQYICQRHGSLKYPISELNADLSPARYFSGQWLSFCINRCNSIKGSSFSIQIQAECNAFMAESSKANLKHRILRNTEQVVTLSLRV